MAMIFDSDETEDVYARIGRWYTKQTLDEDEDDEYGSPILKHTVWNKPLDTAESFLYALFEFRNQYKDKDVVFCCSQKDVNSYMLMSVEASGDTLQFQFKSIPEMRPMPVDFLAHGVTQEVKDPNALKNMKFSFVCDGKTMDIKELCLDVIRFPESPEIYYVIHAELQPAAAGGKTGVPTDAYANKPPETPDDFVTQCIGLQIRSKRPALAKAPVIFEIPSVPDKYIGDLPEGVPEEIRNALGQLCVVDNVVKKDNHVEVRLMSFDREKEYENVFNGAGEFSSAEIQKKMRAMNPDAALFFIYMGKPYEIDTMEAKIGNPIWCTLVPWGTLDESVSPKYRNEIELWAEWCRDPILSWQV